MFHKNQNMLIHQIVSDDNNKFYFSNLDIGFSFEMMYLENIT